VNNQSLKINLMVIVHIFNKIAVLSQGEPRPVRRGGGSGGTKTPQYAKKVHIFCILYADIVDLLGYF